MESSMTTFQFGQYTVKAVARHYTDTPRQRWSKSKVYGAINALSPELNAELEHWTETPVTEQFKLDSPDEAARIMRGYNRAKRALTRDATVKLTALLGAMSDVFGRTPEVQNFSVKAGCSCSCSPGFVLTSTLCVDGSPVDLFVDKVN